MGFFQKHLQNNMVQVLLALPNLAITSGTVTMLSFFWHWSFVLAPTVYYLIGQVFSVQYSVLFNRGTRVTYTLPKWLGGYSYCFHEEPK